MYGNGVKIGLVCIHLQRRPILQGLQPATAAPFAAARGTAFRSIVSLPVADSKPLAVAATILASAWPGPLSFYPFYLFTFLKNEAPKKGLPNKLHDPRGMRTARPPRHFRHVWPFISFTSHYRCCAAPAAQHCILLFPIYTKKIPPGAGYIPGYIYRSTRLYIRK